MGVVNITANTSIIYPNGTKIFSGIKIILFVSVRYIVIPLEKAAIFKYS